MKYCKFCMELKDDGSIYCPACGKKQNSETPPHRLAVGTVLNRKYLVGEALGEGGFGITYIGRDTLLDMKVAIKEYYPAGYVYRSNTVSQTLFSTTSTDRKDFFEKGLDRFLQEARILARFSGENGIVEVRDFFEENNTAYIVMEYLKGQTLKEYINNNGPLTPDQTIRLLMPVILSLKKVHQQGLIHRDISPDNIMLVGGNVKLLDFGAARMVSAGSNKSLSIMLKPGYAPEEQYRSKGVQGPWTDIYSLCATMYKCITGRTPDDANDRAYNDELKKPSELGVYINPEIEKTIMKGLNILYENRYQSIDDFLGALNGIDTEKDRKNNFPLNENTLILLESNPVSDTYESLNTNRNSANPYLEQPNIYKEQQNFYNERSNLNNKQSNLYNGQSVLNEEQPKNHKWIFWLAAAIGILIVAVIIIISVLSGNNKESRLVENTPSPGIKESTVTEEVRYKNDSDHTDYTESTENTKSTENSYVTGEEENILADEPTQLAAPSITSEITSTATPIPADEIKVERKKVKNVEDEVLKIRKIYNEIEDNRSKKYYTVKDVKTGVKEYIDPVSQNIICIVVSKGTDGSNYTRYYYFNNEELIFAYLEGGDAHRLYFKDGFMFRWRYTSDAKKKDNLINHDNELTEEFLGWEDFATKEADKYVGIFIPSEDGSSITTIPVSTPTSTPIPNVERKKVADVEGEVLKIRKIYNEIEDNRSKKYYNTKEVKKGVKEYLDPYSGDVICIIISKGIDGSNYSRYYYFNDGMLMFVYLEGSDAHRLYFKDGYLFRWRYSSDSKKPEKSDYHDNGNSEEYLKWEDFVTKEADSYVDIL